MQGAKIGTRIAVFGAAVTLFSWAGTYLVAYSFAFSKYLPLGTEVVGIPLYAPWAFISWQFRFFELDPAAFQSAATLVTLGAVGALFLARGVSEQVQKKGADTFGSARFATEKELEKAGFFADNGVHLGKSASGKVIRYDGPGHVSVIGPTRAGKGVNTVIPTALTYKGSLIVTDIKSEVWNLTAHARKEWSDVLYFNPLDLHSCHYNPMLAVRRGFNPEGGRFNPVADAQLIATTIMTAPEAAQERMTHWDRTGRDLLTAIILYELYYGRRKTLEAVSDILNDPAGVDLRDHLQLMMDAPPISEQDDPGVTKAIKKGAGAMLSREPKEFSHIQSTCNGFLGLWSDPIISKISEDSDFAVEDFVRGARPVTLYLCVPPAHLDRVQPLFRLLVEQICGRLTETIADSSTRRRVLFLLDEFPNLGRMEVFEKRVPYMAGFGLSAVMVSQDLKQLTRVYGKDHSLIANSRATLFFPTNDHESADAISRIVGKATVEKDRRTISGKRASFWFDNESLSKDETGRQLLNPDEIRTLESGTALLCVEGLHTARVKRFEYFSERDLSARTKQRIEFRSEGSYPFGPREDEGEGGGSIGKRHWGIARRSGEMAQYQVVENK